MTFVIYIATYGLYINTFSAGEVPHSISYTLNTPFFTYAHYLVRQATPITIPGYAHNLTAASSIPVRHWDKTCAFT